MSFFSNIYNPTVQITTQKGIYNPTAQIPTQKKEKVPNDFVFRQLAKLNKKVN